MENLASPHDNAGFGAAFVQAIEAEGSTSVIAPLEIFLAECRDPSTLRKSSQVARAALLADVAHFMCVSHGRQPGVIDHAATKIIEDGARDWLLKSINSFAAERSYLTKLTVSAGPMNSHNGQDKVSALLASQAKSFKMLATSDRAGCAAGAALAFAIDWHATRPLLDGVALLLGVEPPACSLPSKSEAEKLAETLAISPLVERAMHFGANQLLAQQRGLWKIVAARHAEFRELG